MKLSRKWRESILRKAKAKFEDAGEDDTISLEADEMIEMTIANDSLKEQVAFIEGELTALMRDTDDESLSVLQATLANSFEKMMVRVSKKGSCPCPFCTAEGTIIANSLVNMALVVENATKYRRDYLQTAQLMYTLFLTSERSLTRLEMSRSKSTIIGSISGDMAEMLGLGALRQSGHGSPSASPMPDPPTSAELAKPQEMVLEALGRIPAMVSEGQDVMLLKSGPNRISVIRLIWQLWKSVQGGMGLGSIRDMVDSETPTKICTVEYPEEAMAIQYALSRLGASATFQRTPI